MPTAFKRAKPNWPPILEEEIPGHESEKASLTKWIQWQRKRCTRVANPSSGNRKPRTQLYFATNSAKKKAKGVYRIKGLGPWPQSVSIILTEINSRFFRRCYIPRISHQYSMNIPWRYHWYPPLISPQFHWWSGNEASFPTSPALRGFSWATSMRLRAVPELPWCCRAATRCWDGWKISGPRFINQYTLW